MREALFFSSLPVDLQYSILNDDSMPYDAESLADIIQSLPALPDCFVADEKNFTPPLTSVNVNKSMLGKKIIDLLLDRIANPMQANNIIHIASKLVIRSST